jgi:predicted transcriptional regulator of viral defense system
MNHEPTISNTENGHSHRLIELARQQGVLRAVDLEEQAIPRVYLTRLVADGVLERPSRGIYILAGADVTENHSLAEAGRRVPHGVVCLLSALQFHGLTTQFPFEVWLAIDRKARLPKVESPPLRIVRFSGSDLLNGVVAHNVEGVMVKVTDPARTIVDCFAYRKKIGIDVALEALRDCLRKKKASPDDLYRAAKSRRMANVMRPYLEATLP